MRDRLTACTGPPSDACLIHPVFWVLYERSGDDEHLPGDASYTNSIFDVLMFCNNSNKGRREFRYRL